MTSPAKTLQATTSDPDDRPVVGCRLLRKLARGSTAGRLARIVWFVAGLGAVGALLGIPLISAAMARAMPFYLILLGLGLLGLMFASNRRADSRARIRAAWTATAWLLLVSVLAGPLLSAPALGLAATAALVAGSVIAALTVDALSLRFIPT